MYVYMCTFFVVCVCVCVSYMLSPTNPLLNSHLHLSLKATAGSGDPKVVDIAPFIRKDRPSTEVLHSVGGLNKTVAQEQWKVINLSNYQDAGNEAASLDQQLGAGATAEQNLRIEHQLERMDKEVCVCVCVCVYTCLCVPLSYARTH